MKIYLLISILLVTINLFSLSECAPQQGRPRPRPRPNRPAPVDPNTSTTTPSPSTTARTTPSQQFFQCLQNCPTTSEYNPICGSNQMVYLNMGKFKCAQMCGSDAQFVRNGNCAGLF